MTLQSLERALQWASYPESHARRIYATVTSSDVVEGRALTARILDRSLPTEFELRKVYRQKWMGLSDRDTVYRAAQFLCDLDWLTERSEQTGGRPRTVYIVNPRIFEMRDALASDKTAKRGQKESAA